MSSAETTDERLWRIEAQAVGVGAVGGLLAGGAMGVLLQVGTELLPVLGALLGRASMLRGWVVHLSISLLYGVVFTVIMAYPPICSFVASFDTREYVFAGVTYAVMIAAVTITLLPFVFELPWAPAAAQPPNVPGPGLGGLLPAAVFGIAHIVYGAILGAVYASRVAPAD